MDLNISSVALMWPWPDSDCPGGQGSRITWRWAVSLRERTRTSWATWSQVPCSVHWATSSAPCYLSNVGTSCNTDVQSVKPFTDVNFILSRWNTQTYTELKCLNYLSYTPNNKAATLKPVLPDVINTLSIQSPYRDNIIQQLITSPDITKLCRKHLYIDSYPW